MGLRSSSISGASSLTGPGSLPQVEEESVITRRILETLKSAAPARQSEQLKCDFSKISPENLQKVLDEFFTAAIEELGEEVPPRVTELLANIIPQEQLEEACFQGKGDALKKAKSLFHQAKYYLENSEVKASATLRSRFEAFIDVIIAFIESILVVFGVEDIFKPATSKMEHDQKFHKIMMLVSFFTMLTAMLIPFFGVEVVSSVVGGTFLVIGVLSLIYPYFGPIPNDLPCNVKNWTKEYRQGELGDQSFIKGRQATLHEIAATLTNSQNGRLKKHPLLIGESRVGKTQTIKAFVEAIERGDYPELKGKKVFYLSTSKLCKKECVFQGKDPAEKISEAIKHHKEEVVLVFDEIHIAFQGEKNSLVSQKLKDMLDVGRDFPYVIGITTTKEFKDNIVQDTAFVNRFNVIEVESTNREVTLEILRRSLLTSSPISLCEKGALEDMFELTKKQPQPYASRLLLDRCISLTSHRQQSAKVKQLEALKSQRDSFASEGIDALFDQKDSTESIEQLDREITQLQDAVNQEQRQLRRLFQIRGKMATTKKTIYKMVAKASDLKERELNRFILMSQLMRSMLEYVRRQEKELGVKVIIDNNVIKDAHKLEESFQGEKKEEGATSSDCCSGH